MTVIEHDPKHVEAVLVAADRLREAYEAMIEGRDVGWLQDWQPSADHQGAVSLTDDQRRVVVPILTGALELGWPLTDAERRTLRGAINALDNRRGQ